MKRTGAILAAGVPAAGISACDGQAAPDYRGEPLAQLGGTISTAPSTVVGAICVVSTDASIAWPLFRPAARPLAAMACLCGRHRLLA